MMFNTNTTLAMVWAIVSKDLLAAIKNKTILVTILGITAGLAVYFIGPSLLGKDDLPGLVVVGEQTDTLVADFLHNSALNLILVHSQSEMEHTLGESDEPLLGIISPTDMAASDSGHTLVLDAYMDHWVADDQIAATKRFFETQLSNWAGQMVDLNIHHDQVYTQIDGTHPFNLAFPMIGLLLFIGISIGPNLLLEEKETKTLDMLLISPASIGQIVIGKALVAVLYGIIAALILFVLNNPLVAHWPVAILVACCGSLFVSSIGLLMGVALNNRQQLIIWSQVVLIGLLLPIFLHAILQSTPVGKVLEFIPTVALGKLVRIALSNNASISTFSFELVWLSMVTIVLLVLVGWIIRRSLNESVR